MERLTQSRRSSNAGESDISEMENEIMQKSGISITKESESPTKLPQEQPSSFNRQMTPAMVHTDNAASSTSSGGNFVSGTEEDLLTQNQDEEDE